MDKMTKKELLILISKIKKKELINIINTINININTKTGGKEEIIKKTNTSMRKAIVYNKNILLNNKNNIDVMTNDKLYLENNKNNIDVMAKKELLILISKMKKKELINIINTININIKTGGKEEIIKKTNTSTRKAIVYNKNILLNNKNNIDVMANDKLYLENNKNNIDVMANDNLYLENNK
jgi:ribosomal protein S9